MIADLTENCSNPARAREGWKPVMPEIECDEPRTYRYVPGLKPAFTQHLSSSWLSGGMLAAAEGYTHQSVSLWGPLGQPVALSRQTMVVFG